MVVGVVGVVVYNDAGSAKMIMQRTLNRLQNTDRILIVKRIGNLAVNMI